MRLLLILLFAMPSIAFAHAPIEGVNHFLNGLLHPVLVPAHIMLLLGLGLLIGRQGNEAIMKVMPVFMLILIPSVLLSIWSVDWKLEVVLLVLAMIQGGLLVWGKPLSITVLRATAIIIAILVGIDSPQETFSGKERYMALFGTIAGASFSVVYIAGFTEIIRNRLNGIPIRVLGSWLTASSLMVLVLSLQ